MSDVTSYPTAELHQVTRRITDGSHFSPTPCEHGYLIANVKDMKSGEIDFSTCTRISPSAYRELRATGCTIKNGNVLLSKDGTVGRVVVYKQDTEIGALSSICIIEPTDRLDAAFLGHALQSEGCLGQYDNFLSGSALRRLVLRDIRSIKVPLPDSEHQRTIAQVLDTLDTAIHETEAIIAKLKAVKQGLLHDLLTRGIDANGELRPPQAEAPHLYKESPLGWIPKEWEFGALQTWLAGKPRNGYSPREAGEWTGIQMLGLGCLTNEGFEHAQLKPAPRGDRRLATATLSDGDLLMSRSNTRDLVGLAGVYRDVGTPCTYPDLMMRLRPSPETIGEFLQFVLRSPVVRRQIQAHAVGTSGSMVKISGKIVCELASAMPRKQEQERILSCLAAADSRLRAAIEEVSVLRDIKSALMDDLLTGRVRVTPLLEDTAP